MIIDRFLFWAADKYLAYGKLKGFITDRNYSDKDLVFRELLWNITVGLIIFSISLFMQTFKEAFLMFVFFNIGRNIRSSGMGYHSWNNLTFCLMLSILQFTFMPLLSKHYTLNIVYLQILNVVSIIYIINNIPQYNSDFEEYPVDILNMKQDFLIFSFVAFVVSIYVKPRYAASIHFSMVFIAIFMCNNVILKLKKIRYLIFKN